MKAKTAYRNIEISNDNLLCMGMVFPGLYTLEVKNTRKIYTPIKYSNSKSLNNLKKILEHNQQKEIIIII